MFLRISLLVGEYLPLSFERDLDLYGDMELLFLAYILWIVREIYSLLFASGDFANIVLCFLTIGLSIIVFLKAI